MEPQTLLDRSLEASASVVFGGDGAVAASEAPLVLLATRDPFLDSGGVGSAGTFLVHGAAHPHSSLEQT